MNREAKLGLTVSLHEGPPEDLIHQLPPDVTRGNVSFSRAAVAMDRARIDPEEAMRIAASLEDPVSRDFALRGVAMYIAALLPEIAKEAISAIGDSKERSGAIEILAHQLGTQSPHEGSKILADLHAKQLLTDEAIAMFVQTSAAADIDGAIVWLEEIQDAETRQKVLNYLEGSRLKERSEK